MSWFGFGATKPAPPTRINIPLFPLKAVLLPGGVMGLKIFEQRYLDMAAECLRDKTPFGICLIRVGEETGEAAVPHSVGVLAHLLEADMAQLGILQVRVLGGQRFRIIEAAPGNDQLLRGTVELIDEAPVQAVPAALSGLLPFLHQVVADLGEARMPAPHRWDDAAWVGYRLTEIVPVQPLARQKLLELDDPVSRLEIIFRYLAQRGLVK